MRLGERAPFLIRRLLLRPPAPLTPCQVIGWWEMRRIPYNLIVGATGLATSFVMLTMAIICDRLIGVPIGMPDPPIVAVLGVIVYAIMANVCYTGGWVVELFLAHVVGVRPARFAEIAFGLGLMGSVALTLLPAVVTVAGAVTALAASALGGSLPDTVPGS
jgi:hypothetical protein